MILVVDNYDSFTFNLVQALQAAGAEVRVVRNDAIDRAGVEALADDPEAHLRGIVISPGPGDPDDAGVSVATIEVAAQREIPLLGVCLGMQSMAAAFGASIVRAPTLVHGEASEVTHDGAGLLAGMPPSFMGARYHSLAVDAATLPPELRVTAMSEVDRRDHGHPPRRPADGGRPVPPRERADAPGPAPARQLPAPGRGRGGVAGSMTRPGPLPRPASPSRRRRRRRRRSRSDERARPQPPWPRSSRAARSRWTKPGSRWAR